MLLDFQLGALARTGKQWRLLRIPMHQDLQGALAEVWGQQYQDFVSERQVVSFNPGYKPEANEYLGVGEFQLPGWLQESLAGGIGHLTPISSAEDLVDSIKAIIALARTEAGESLLLAQSFGLSHVIEPNRFLFQEDGTYVSKNRKGLTLASRLTAVYRIADQNLLFENFRSTNAFLPLTGIIAEASDQEIRDVLSHDLLVAQDADATVASASQWSRKRFAMLRASGVLDQFTTDELVQKSTGYEVDIQLQDGRIVFPSDKAAAKRVLQFLNEEIFKGAITEKLYETNSKREADE